MASINYLTLRPEQAIKMYKDNVMDNKHYEALQILVRYISSFGVRNRKTGYDQVDISVASNIQYLQKLMTGYIDLRLQLGVNTLDDQNQMKEVLKAYRQMTQHNHSDAFNEILDHYRIKVEAIFHDKIKLYEIEELQKLPFVGQLSYEEPAEELLYLSFDPEAKAYKDSQKGCLRLIWEAYRTIMENVKWNEKMEELYFGTLKRVSDFCLQYKRKGEFQWFCEQINRFVLDLNVRDVDLKKNPSHVDLSKTATNDKHIIARFEVVKTAMALEMWQEAFKTLETIIVLKNMRKGAFRTSYLLQYFEYLAQLFTKSGNSLYQAFAYYNHYLAFRKKPVTTQAEIKTKAEESNVKLNYLMLSVLVIPISVESNESLINEKVTQLFGQGTKIPTREELLKIMGEMNGVQFVTPVVRKVFNLLENKQDLLTVADEATSTFEQLRSSEPLLAQFVPLLEENLITSVLRNISGIYKTIKIESLEALLKFTNRERILQNLLQSNTHKLIECKVDFLSQFIHFNVSQISHNQQILPSILSQFNYPQSSTDPIEAARKQLDTSNLDMLTRQQTIRKLNDQADPNRVKKEHDEARDQEKRNLEKQRRIEDERRKFEQERIAEMESRKNKEIAVRSKLLQDIIKLKGSKFVTFEIHGERKKLEHLKDHHLLEIDTAVLQDIRKKFEEESKKGADDKFIRAFKRTDYIERERLFMEAEVMAKWTDVDLNQVHQSHKQQHEKNIELKHKLNHGFGFVDEEIQSYRAVKQLEFNEQLEQWRKQLKEQYYAKVIEKAQELYQIEQEYIQRQQIEEAKRQQELKDRPQQKEEFVITGKFARGTEVNKTEAPATTGFGFINRAQPSQAQPQQPTTAFTGIVRSNIQASNVIQEQAQQAQQPKPVVVSNNPFAGLKQREADKPMFQRGAGLQATATQQQPTQQQPPAQKPATQPQTLLRRSDK